MATTTKGLYVPDSGTSAPLVPVLSNMQNSVDTYLNGVIGPFATVAARTAAITAPVDGMTTVTLDYNVLWRYSSALSKWVVLNTPTFPDVTTRNTVIPSPVVGNRVYTGSGLALAEYVYDGSIWRQADGNLTESLLTTTLTTVGTVFGSIGASLTQTISNPGPTAIWEVVLELDYQQGSASTVDIVLAVNSVSAGGVSMFYLPDNFRFPISRTFKISGLAAGSVVFDPQIKATVANSCAVIAASGSHMMIKQVA